jgi:hypothetical protein
MTGEADDVHFGVPFRFPERVTIMTPFRVCRRFLGLWLLLAVLGCGFGQRDEGEVNGKVLFKGQPLPSGTVKFVGADGKLAFAVIEKDGSYRIREVAVGRAKISVVSHPRVPEGFQRSGRDAPVVRMEKGVTIPPHYNDPEKSGLTYDVKSGEQTFDIKLRPEHSP